MELLRAILDYLIIPIVLWNIYLTIKFFDMKSASSVMNIELLHLKEKQRDHANTIQQLDTEIKAEFKRMGEKMDEMPQKIVDFIKSTRII